MRAARPATALAAVFAVAVAHASCNESKCGDASGEAPIYAPTPRRVEAPTTQYVRPREATFEPVIQHPSRSATGRFNAAVIFLADQLERNLERRGDQDRFVVTSLANLDNLEQTSALGRLVAEQLIHELTVRRWQVVDVRIGRDIAIKDSGEFSLTRDITRVREQTRASGLVTGTFAVTGSAVLVGVRVVDTSSGEVLSTAQARLSLDSFVSGLLDSGDRNVPVRIIAK